MSSPPTVSKCAVERLAALDIDHCFAVPGDDEFPFTDALAEDGKSRRTAKVEFVTRSVGVPAGFHREAILAIHLTKLA